MKRLYLIIILVGFLPGTGWAASPESGFAEFFSSFQAALKKSDYDYILDHTKFPITVNGTLDSDDKKVYTKQSFKDVMPQLLQSDSGMSAEEVPMTDYLQAYKPQANEATAGPVHLANFTFCQDSGEWKLCSAYSE